MSKLGSLKSQFMAGLAICAVVVAAARAQDLKREGRWYVTEIKKTFQVGADGMLEMRNVNGDVTVQSWAQNSVEIIETLRMDVFTEEEARHVREASEASYSQSGNRIVVEGRERSRRSVDSYFKVNVPATFGLDISTSGGDLSVYRVKGTTTLHTSGGNIDLIETGGTVRANTSGGDVNVRDAEGDLVVKTSGGNLELERIKGTLDAKTSGGNITLRVANKSVDLSTSGGNIEIIDVEGNVNARTSGGNVEVDNTGGRVDVATSGGDLVLRDIKGELDGATSGGDIRAERLHATSRLATSGGDVIVRDLMASLSAETSGGNVEVEMTLTDFKKPHSLTLSSSGGNIELAIPEKLPAKIYAEIHLEDRWSWGERYDISSDFPLKIERGEGERRWGKYIRGEGDINGGGDPITLKTSAGNITIRKLAAR
ncbi:MAG: DUF4097 family beta strand repeat-containing protein [bacterium]